MFFVEQTSNEPSPQRRTSPNILISTELSQNRTAGMPSVSSIASPEPQILAINDSNEPTMPRGFGRQLPIVPPRLNDLNLPPNPFNILATMTAVNHTEYRNNKKYSPSHQRHLIHRPSHYHPWISAHLTVGKHRTPQQTTTPSSRRTSHDVYTGTLPWMKPFFGRRTQTNIPIVHSITAVTSSKDEDLEMGMSFPKRGGVSQHVCEACGQTIPSTKDIPGPSNRD